MSSTALSLVCRIEQVYIGESFISMYWVASIGNFTFFSHSILGSEWKLTLVRAPFSLVWLRLLASELHLPRVSLECVSWVKSLLITFTSALQLMNFGLNFNVSKIDSEMSNLGPQSPVEMKPDTATLMGGFSPGSVGGGNSPTSPRFELLKCDAALWSSFYNCWVSVYLNLLLLLAIRVTSRVLQMATNRVTIRPTIP